MATLKAHWIVGKRIIKVEMNPFDAGRRVGYGTSYSPVIWFEDGSKLRFIVDEVHDGSEYGITPIYIKKQKKGSA